MYRSYMLRPRTRLMLAGSLFVLIGFLLYEIFTCRQSYTMTSGHRLIHIDSAANSGRERAPAAYNDGIARKVEDMGGDTKVDSYGRFAPRDLSELGTHVIPNNVFFVWCGHRTFLYNHYLSVKSVWTFFEPDSLEIHYEYIPQQDKYNDWLQELKTSIANLVLTKIPKWATCNETFRDLLMDRGGVYVSEDTIILRPISHLKSKKLALYANTLNRVKVLFSVPHNSRLDSILNFKRYKLYEKSLKLDNITANLCVTASQMTISLDVSDCCVLQFDLHPKDIIFSPTPLAANLRYIAYGSRAVIAARKDSTYTMPYVVHYIWYNPANMTFVMYMSLLSSLYIAEADKVYIHGGNDLMGPYWDLFKGNPRVVTVKRETPFAIFGNMVYYTHHKSDVIRADIMYKYGGMYVDWDVLWLRSPRDLVATGYDVIVDIDHMPRGKFPDSINMGVVLSKPRSEFIKVWRNRYREYRNDDFYYNPIEVPYKVFEKHPELVRIEPRLQVMCFNLKCHPIFHSDYKNYEESQPFNWRTDAYSIHFTHPDPGEYSSEDAVRRATGMFAEIGQYILDSVKI